MSKIRIVNLDFVDNGGMLQAKDAVLFAAVQKFCTEQLEERPNFGALAKSWAAVRLDAEGGLEEVVGLIGYKMVPDISLFRAIDKGGTVKLAQRINDFFADQGLRMQEVFLHVAPEESPEQRCADFDSTMQLWDAKPANRQKIVVR